MKAHIFLLTLCFCLAASFNLYSATPDGAPGQGGAPLSDTEYISNADFFNYGGSVSGPFGWLKGIKTPKDLLALCTVGIQTRGEVDFTIDTDTSLKNFGNKRTNSKFNFKLDLGLPLGTLSLAYNFNGIDWAGEKHGGRYFLAHINFYNLHAIADIPPFTIMYLPTGTYSWGNTQDMAYRELDLRILLGLGYNETAYVFHNEENPYQTTYYNTKRLTIVGIKGLVEAFADYDLWDLAYGKKPSGLNAMMESALGPMAKFLPMPYANIFMQDSKVETRYYDIITKSIDNPAWGWNFGLLYTRSFTWDIGPGRLIVQPRADLLLFDSSIHDPDHNNGYMAFRAGLRASVDVCYFF